jgi:serine O-acetyltransferase
MRHYRDFGGWHKSLGFWVTATYRFGSWAHGVGVPPVRVACLVAYKLAATPWRFFKHVSIPARTKIGEGLCLHHAHNIVMPPDVEIGSNCTLYHDVTLGLGPLPGVPRLGDNVTIFAGARVLGGVRIGDGAQIGANAVVIRDVEPGSVVSVPAARAIPKETAAAMHAGARPSDRN